MAKERSFGEADKGIAWAASQLPGGKCIDGHITAGKYAVSLLPFDGAKGPDDYAIRFRGAGVEVKCNSPIAAISGLLRLADMLKQGKTENLVQKIRFRTRNYKHEIKLSTGPGKTVVNYADETWHALCQQIVAHQFNGLLLYSAYHPFEFILDYKEFPKAASQPAAERTAIREALNRGLAIAHQYGLKTLMQHYVGHFTQELADAYDIPTTGRLASIEHPEVDRYIRYCYREMFKQVPDLDGMYFNFESTPDATRHVLETAVPEFNRMKKKPIMTLRLWGYVDMDGLGEIMDAYKGPFMVSHKVSDTNDTYYLPAADRRILEWKKKYPNLEWLYCMGPCHNCGTNLCQQVWGDYDFAYDLIADAERLGADSMGFHTIFDFFSSNLPDPKGAFPQIEKDMTRFNRMHLEAVVDYFNYRRKSPAEQAAKLAEVAGLNAQAGRDLQKAVVLSSQQVLLIYQQFCHTSAMDGFLNQGRYTFIQEPYMFFPATAHNNQATRLPWSLGWTNTPWVDKTIDTKVCPDNFLQRVIDYVDPSKPKAIRHPKRIADLLDQYADQSLAAWQAFAKNAPKDLAARFKGHLEQNAALGRYIAHELRAAIALYSIYFAKSKAAIVSALKTGLAELKAMVPTVADPSSTRYKIMHRVTMLDALKPQMLVKEVQETLAAIESNDFPIAALTAFIESHRLYNENRRIIRPFRKVNQKVLDLVRRNIDHATARAQESLTALDIRKHEALVENVKSWIWFLQNEKARTLPPKTVVSTELAAQPLPLQHDDCFQMGRLFTNDFLSFFTKIDYMLPAPITFRAWHTANELVVQVREQGVCYAHREDRWKRWRRSGSDCFVFRVYLDPTNKGKSSDLYTIWPMGEGVSCGRRPNLPAKVDFSHDATGWQMTAHLPFKVIGRKPKKGEMWGMTVSSNPAVIRNYGYNWSPSYDSDGNAGLFGKIRFV